MKSSARRYIAGALLCASAVLTLSAAGSAADPQALQSASKQVMQKMKNSDLHGAGAGVEPIPGTDSQAVVSYGSASVKKDAEGNSTAQDKLVAQRASRTQADAALAALVSGMKGAAKAVLPPGVDSSSWTTEDGKSVSANVYTPELSKQLKVKNEAKNVSALSAASAASSWTAAGNGVEQPAPADGSAQTVQPDPASAQSGDLYPELRNIAFDEAMVSRIDWVNGFVEISGEGAAPAGKSAPQGRLLARRAATADMQRKYIEFLQGAVVQSATQMKDFEVQNEHVSSEISGIARNISVSDEKWDGGIYTVTGRMQLQDVQRFLKSMRLYVKQ